MNNNTKTKFFVELIKPSHYDDDGYVIQWWKSFICTQIIKLTHKVSKTWFARANNKLSGVVKRRAQDFLPFDNTTAHPMIT